MWFKNNYLLQIKKSFEYLEALIFRN